jgi:hypothetical protein
MAIANVWSSDKIHRLKIVPPIALSTFTIQKTRQSRRSRLD